MFIMFINSANKHYKHCETAAPRQGCFEASPDPRDPANHKHIINSDYKHYKHCKHCKAAGQVCFESSPDLRRSPCRCSGSVGQAPLPPPTPPHAPPPPHPTFQSTPFSPHPPPCLAIPFDCPAAAPAALGQSCSGGTIFVVLLRRRCPCVNMSPSL